MKAYRLRTLIFLALAFGMVGSMGASRRMGRNKAELMLMVILEAKRSFALKVFLTLFSD